MLFELAHAALSTGDADRHDETHTTNDISDTVLLEPSMFAWALTVLRPTDAAAVGGNFGLPHRDYSFTDAWRAGERKATFVIHVVLFTRPAPRV